MFILACIILFCLTADYGARKERALRHAEEDAYETEMLDQ